MRCTATGLFKTVNVSMQGSVLVVQVSENAIVASVLFQGNQRFSDANLVAMIDLMNRGHDRSGRVLTATSPASRSPTSTSATPSLGVTTAA